MKYATTAHPMIKIIAAEISLSFFKDAFLGTEMQTAATIAQSSGGKQLMALMKAIQTGAGAR